MDPDDLLAEDAARLGIGARAYARRFGLLGASQLSDIRQHEWRMPTGDVGYARLIVGEEPRDDEGEERWDCD